MSLPHVLLGLLIDQPATGYDLERMMRTELDPIWRAEFSQIYPQLARLRRAGHVVLRVLGPRRGPRRNRYRITAAGRRELQRWLGAPPPPPRTRDDLLVRIALFDTLSPADRREARRGALEKLEAMRRWLKTLSHPTLSAGLPTLTAPKKK